MKKIIAVLAALVAVFLIVFLGIQTYRYYNLEVEIHISKGANEDIDDISLAFNQRSIFGINEARESELVTLYVSEVRPIIERVKLEMESPRELHIDVTNNAGKTYIHFSGSGTVNGSTEIIDEEVVLNFPSTVINE